MGYKQPKNTPLHGAPMYSKRDGSSMFGPSEYDAMQEGAAMKDTYVTKDGASEPISAAIGLKLLGKKLIAGLTKKKIAAAAKKAAAKGAANLAQRGIQKAMTPKEEEVPSGDTSPDTFSQASGGGGYAGGGGMSMGPSKGGKINFGEIFKNIDLKGKLQRKPKAVTAYDAPTLQSDVSKLKMAGRKVKSFTGMAKNYAVDGVKKAASSDLGKASIMSAATAGAANLANRVTQKKEEVIENVERYAMPSTQHSYSAYGYAGGGGTSMHGASMPVNDSTHTHNSYKFQSGEGGENQSKIKGMFSTANNELMRVSRPISIGDGKIIDGRNVAIAGNIAANALKSRSSQPQPITGITKKKSIIPVSMDTTNTRISQYAKAIND